MEVTNKIMETSSVQKESPIDLLMTQLYKKGFLKEVDGNEPINLMNKAKEMEKEEQRQTFEQSRLTNAFVGFKYENFEQYYNETYGDNK